MNYCNTKSVYVVASVLLTLSMNFAAHATETIENQVLKSAIGTLTEDGPIGKSGNTSRRLQAITKVTSVLELVSLKPEDRSLAIKRLAEVVKDDQYSRCVKLSCAGGLFRFMGEKSEVASDKTQLLTIPDIQAIGILVKESPEPTVRRAGVMCLVKIGNRLVSLNDANREKQDNKGLLGEVSDQLSGLCSPSSNDSIARHLACAAWAQLSVGKVLALEAVAAKTATATSGEWLADQPVAASDVPSSTTVAGITATTGVGGVPGVSLTRPYDPARDTGSRTTGRDGTFGPLAPLAALRSRNGQGADGAGGATGARRRTGSPLVRTNIGDITPVPTSLSNDD